jgi:hypothetical protein
VTKDKKVGLAFGREDAMTKTLFLLSPVFFGLLVWGMGFLISVFREKFEKKGFQVHSQEDSSWIIWRTPQETR